MDKRTVIIVTAAALALTLGEACSNTTVYAVKPSGSAWQGIVPPPDTRSYPNGLNGASGSPIKADHARRAADSR